MILKSKKKFNIIKNKDKLISKGNIEGRKLAVDILEYAINKINTYILVIKLIKLKDNILYVDKIKYDLSKYNNIYVLGAGKATFEIAKALEDILKEKIKDGVIIEKRGKEKKLEKIRVFEASHPIPDKAGLEGAFEVAKLAELADYGDLVLVAVTGGCSALMPLPAKSISLEDKKKVNNLLLECGASIDEINTIRKHISSIKGGRLALMIHPAEIINLIVIDEVAGKPWGPTIPDETTFEDAVEILKKNDLWKKIPDNVRLHLKKSKSIHDTPKPVQFETLGIKSNTFIIAKNEDACEAAAEMAKKLEYSSSILTTVLEGESKDVGIVLSKIALETEKNSRPFKPPCVLISGGETTVSILESAGMGGRNQELALSASTKISGSKHIVLASIGTDGTDGPTDFAGAIIDGYTVMTAKQLGLNPVNELKKHNSSHFFRKLEDAIYTGSTGTNVMDLQIIVITE